MRYELRSPIIVESASKRSNDPYTRKVRQSSVRKIIFVFWFILMGCLFYYFLQKRKSSDKSNGTKICHETRLTRWLRRNIITVALLVIVFFINVCKVSFFYLFKIIFGLTERTFTYSRVKFQWKRFFNYIYLKTIQVVC